MSGLYRNFGTKPSLTSSLERFGLATWAVRPPLMSSPALFWTRWRRLCKFESRRLPPFYCHDPGRTPVQLICDRSCRTWARWSDSFMYYLPFYLVRTVFWQFIAIDALILMLGEKKKNACIFRKHSRIICCFHFVKTWISERGYQKLKNVGMAGRGPSSIGPGTIKRPHAFYAPYIWSCALQPFLSSPSALFSS